MRELPEVYATANQGLWPMAGMRKARFRRPKGIACHAAKSRTDTRGHTVLTDMCVWAQLRCIEHTKHAFATPGRACLTGKKPCPRLVAIFKSKR